MTTLYRQRTAFEKQLLAEIGPHLKRSEWKKSSCALFRQSNSIYQDIFISVHRNSAATTTELRIKPMALDPILWDILDIPENRDKPLSFRTWGAFTCSGIPVYGTQMESPGDTAGDVARRLTELYKGKINLADQVLSDKPFSELAASHPNQVERGAYAVTLVTSLISDGISTLLMTRPAHMHPERFRPAQTSLVPASLFISSRWTGWMLVSTQKMRSMPRQGHNSSFKPNPLRGSA